MGDHIPRTSTVLPLLGSMCLAAQALMSLDPLREPGNNCGHGKLLPALYVLGAKNAATTSLYNDIRGATGVMTTRGKKESFFFKRHAALPAESQFDLWFNALPACPSRQAYLGDFDTTNLYTAPFPSDLRWAKNMGYPMHHTPHPRNWDTPRWISEFHKRAGGRPPKLVLLLRDPLERMQSEYYHTLFKRNCLGCMVNSTFAGSFEANVAALLRSPRRLSDWSWKSFYARQAEGYLKHFDAAQFVFLPNNQYLSSNSTDFSTSLLSHLGLEGKPWAEASHANFHKARPPLDTELPPSAPSRLSFDAAMAPETERLVRLMARAQLGGAWLVGYAGQPGDEAQIRAWLEGSW